MTRTRPREVEPVTNRVLVLQAVRLVVAVALPVITALAGKFDISLIPLAFGYALVIVAGGIVRRRFPRLDGPLMSLMVLVDGLVLATAVTRTGGYRSPLLFLVFVLVVAATLLVSYRTGLELAAWCALLLLLAHAASDAGIITSEVMVSDRFALVSASTFLVFALCAAAFSWVNERDAPPQPCATRVAGRALHRPRALAPRRRRDGDARPAHVRSARLHACRGAREAGRRLVGSARRRRRRVPGRVGRERHAAGAGVVVELVATARAVARRRAARRRAARRAQRRRRAGLRRRRAIRDRGRPSGAAETTSRSRCSRCGRWPRPAMHTASALHTAALLDEVERLATRDSLTGIANRRLFDESLGREASRAQRLRTSLSLIVFDVDHFKQINDTYGHLDR